MTTNVLISNVTHLRRIAEIQQCPTKVVAAARQLG
jgi:hypothetical protein